jgi:hypothetical protein
MLRRKVIIVQQVYVHSGTKRFASESLTTLQQNLVAQLQTGLEGTSTGWRAAVL